jgi:chromosome segregation ATPase
MTQPPDTVEALSPLELIHVDAAALDAIARYLKYATERLDDAEEAWETVYDKVAESLKEEMEAQDRKGDPAEHVIVSTTRRQHRAVWVEYRRARRDLGRLETQLQAKKAALSGRQSELRALGAEVDAQDSLGQPQWSQPRTAA